MLSFCAKPPGGSCLRTKALPYSGPQAPCDLAPPTSDLLAPATLNLQPCLIPARQVLPRTLPPGICQACFLITFKCVPLSPSGAAFPDVPILGYNASSVSPSTTVRLICIPQHLSPSHVLYILLVYFLPLEHKMHGARGIVIFSTAIFVEWDPAHDRPLTNMCRMNKRTEELRAVFSESSEDQKRFEWPLRIC